MPHTGQPYTPKGHLAHADAAQEVSPYFISRQNFDNSHFSNAAMAFGESEPTFREYCRIIAKHWRLITAIFSCSLTAAGLVVFLMPSIYTATSTVLIEPRAPQVLGINELETGETDAGNEVADDNYYGTEYKILQSRSLAARVIRELNLQSQAFLRAGEHKGLESNLRLPSVLTQAPVTRDPVVADKNAGTLGVGLHIIDTYLKHLTIRSDPGTRLVNIAFSSPDPVLSARIVNAHVQAYIKRGMELHAEASESAEKYLQRKLTELQTRVEKSEKELNDYRRRRGIVADSSGDDNRVALDRLVDLNKALTDQETQRITLEAEDQLIASRHYDALPDISKDAVIENLRQQEARIQGEYASMADQYKPNYPPLAELGAQLRETQRRISQEIHRVATGVALSYTASLQREKALNQKIAQEKDRLLALNDASLKDAILARAVDTNRKLYKNVLERMTQMGMAAGVSASNVSVLDNAVPPLEPSSPKKLLTLVSSGLFGLLLAVSSACFLERLDDTFKDPDDLERYLGLPSLALVPDFRKLNGSASGAKKQLASFLSSTRTKTANPIITGDLGIKWLAAAEAYRSLRLNLLLSRPGNSPKVVLITSGLPNEGKTVTAINTAIAFAQMGSKVLLIDADLRASQCHKFLDMDNSYGLTEVLTGRRRLDEVTHPSPVQGLTCITAGSRPPNPGMLLGSSTMTDVLSVLRSNYDCILIDSAPVMPVTDTLHLMTIVDGVVLVNGPSVPRQRVKYVCTRLAQIHAPLLGIVQNQVDIAMHSATAGYYYPHYHTLPASDGEGDAREA
jgi:succinoglycan biosynthesis transport protein ExoP